MKHQNRFSAWKYSEVIGQDPKGPETVGPALSRRLGQMSPRRPNPHCSTCPWKASMRFYWWIDILFLKVRNKSNLHNFSVTMQNIWLTCHKKFLAHLGACSLFSFHYFKIKITIMLTICESIILSSIWVIYATSDQILPETVTKPGFVLENNVCWVYNKLF